MATAVSASTTCNKPIGSRKPVLAQADANYKFTTWENIKVAITHIYNRNATALSFEELYRSAYNMIVYKYGDFLYENLRTLMHEHLSEDSKYLCSIPNEELLVAIRKKWYDNEISHKMIRDILMYLNSVYIPQNSLTSIYETGLSLFLDLILRNPEIRRRQQELVLDVVQRDRNGEVVDRSMLKFITGMLLELGNDVYVSEFETPYIAQLMNSLKTDSCAKFTELGPSGYLLYAENRIQQECDRALLFLDISSSNKVKDVVEVELLSNHLQNIIYSEGGLVSMLKNENVKDAYRMYNLLARVGRVETTSKKSTLAGNNKNTKSNVSVSSSATTVSTDDTCRGHVEMCKALSGHLLLEGKTVIDTAEGSFIDALLTLHDKYEMFLTKSFANNTHFHLTIRHAFDTFINNSDKTPEYLSLYIDEKLRKGLKGATDAEVDATLNRVITIFKYVSEKDVFERYFKQHLARRLLSNNSVSNDAEQQMISKFKAVCGIQFTSKLEIMFTDIRTSADVNERFAQQGISYVGPAINTQILTSGMWPITSVNMCNLPKEVAVAAEAFKEFYLANQSGRRLFYQPNFGTAEIKMMCEKKKYEVTMTTNQMVVLMLFNDKPTYKVSEIIELSNLSEKDVIRCVIALSHAKHPILTGNKEDKCGRDTIVSVNNKFRSKLYKIRIGTAGAQKEDDTQVQQTRAKIDEERAYHIDAAIVRIMKSRKTLSHNELISETIKILQSRFLPEPVAIKKRLGTLFEREYLERDKNDMRLYHYVA